MSETEQKPQDWVIPSSPADKQKIAEALEEMVNSLTRRDAENQHIKAIRERLLEEFAMPKALSYRIAQDKFKDSIRKRLAEGEDYQDTIDALFPELSNSGDQE